MSFKIIKAGHGLILKTKKYTYAIDAAEGRIADYHIISHAHFDHLPKRPLGKVIASKETISLAFSRTIIRNPNKAATIELINSGHILGSRAALIENKILYTGDFNLKSRLFIKGFDPPEADILIIESTYGDPRFRFESFNEMIRYVNNLLTDLLSEGNNILAIGYPLGKSQILTKLFEWFNNVYVSGPVEKYNSIYRKFDVDLHNFKRWIGKAEEPFILIGRLGHRDVKDALSRYNLIKLEFSGWSLIRKSGDSIGIALSDHSDFYDILRVIDKVSPSKIYTYHGYSKKLANFLKYLGYDAESI